MSVISVVCIMPQSDGLFIFDPEGEPYAISQVHDRHGELVDFVAWQPEKPGKWWLRRGDATPFLGTRNLAMAAYYGDPITLHQTPQDWLIAGRQGACVLKWDWPIARLFHGCGTIECVTPELHQRLLASLRREEPNVIVRQEAHHAA